MSSSTELIELRQYLLHPGQRDTLIELFDREFVETQEAAGIAVLGQFRDPQRPNHFVWLRGFPDMHSRHASLTAFYDGSVWAQHRNAANATMVDSDNVLLLHPATPNDQLSAQDVGARDTQPSTGRIGVVVDYVQAITKEVVESFRAQVIPALIQLGARTLGVYTTGTDPNTFPRLPVRGDNAIVWIGTLNGDVSAFNARPPGDNRKQDRHVLIPTQRSALRGTT
jgi:hypothetical protein